MSGGDKARQDTQPAFVLHRYAFRETSLVIEAFTRQFGRVGLVARGARRPKSALRGVLLAFQPLLLSWAGRSELRTLVRAEWLGGLPQLKGLSLICGFYLNELLLKLVPRDDPHEQLFAIYEEALHALGGTRDHAAVLRRFEKRLLKELGYALTLDREAESGAPVSPGGRYTYVIERGPVAVSAEDGNRLELTGRTLLDMAADDYRDPLTQQQSKALMRSLITHYLGSQVLHTRQLLRDLQEL
ncbi:MAG: DNA repair protein RecO [Betaproteobacteria bacterium]|nr:DNA repair protein RecO [Betaproteobacteria bacterium]